jgi:hypothetical protein
LGGVFGATAKVPGRAPPIFPGVPGLSAVGSAPATPASGTDKAPAAATVTNSFLIMFFPWFLPFAVDIVDTVNASAARPAS